MKFILGQQYSTGVPQEFLKHAIPDYLVRGTDLFSLTLSNRKIKNMSQMKEQIKAPEKIQLSDEEIANLSDTLFKTLVISMLQKLTGYCNSIKKTQCLFSNEG